LVTRFNRVPLEMARASTLPVGAQPPDTFAGQSEASNVALAALGVVSVVVAVDPLGVPVPGDALPVGWTVDGRVVPAGPVLVPDVKQLRPVAHCDGGIGSTSVFVAQVVPTTQLLAGDVVFGLIGGVPVPGGGSGVVAPGVVFMGLVVPGAVVPGVVEVDGVVVGELGLEVEPLVEPVPPVVLCARA
jgi:hypothetical protein